MVKRKKESFTPLTLTVVNSATGKPVVYAGEANSLTITLTNNTGSAISLLAGSQPSTLELFLPTFFSLNDLGKMQVSIAGWNCAVNSDDESLMLTCTQAGNWANGADLSFQITQVQSSASPPQGGDTQINPSGMTGHFIPSQVTSGSPLTLQVKPDNKKGDLSTVLQTSLDNNGLIYVSESSNMLIPNTLSLNIKNISSKPLYTGDTPWSSAPKVLVYFVYGATSGSLAPDDKSTPPVESAWNIQPGKVISEGNSWAFSDDESGEARQPQWKLTPNASNPGILGTGDAANITFEFKNIVSMTPPGHTQMYVQFSGFPDYNDHLFVLDILKLDPPDTEEIINFIPVGALSDEVNYTTFGSPATLTFRWQLYQISQVELMMINAASGIHQKVCTRKYAGILNNDSYEVTFPQLVHGSYPFHFVLNGFDQFGNQCSQSSLTIQMTSTVQAQIVQFQAAVSSLDIVVDQAVTLDLNWEVFGPGTVEVTSSNAGLGIPPVTRQYAAGGNQAFSDTARITLPIPALYKESHLGFQLSFTAADGNKYGQFCTPVSLQFFFQDNRDGQKYPLVLFNNALWMTQNLNYNDYESNNQALPNGEGYAYGVFGWVAPLQGLPQDWNIITPADWQNVMNLPVEDILPGGSTGLNLENTCLQDANGQPAGFYWLCYSIQYNGPSGVGVISGPPSPQVSVNPVLTSVNAALIRLIKYL